MAAYIVVVELADSDAYGPLRQRLVERLERLGGRYLAAGAPSKVVEGGLDIGRVVIVERDSVESAHAALDSEEYLALRDARARAGAFACVVVAPGL